MFLIFHHSLFFLIISYSWHEDYTEWPCEAWVNQAFLRLFWLLLSFQEIVYLVLWDDFGPGCSRQHSFKCEGQKLESVWLEKKESKGGEERG